jgi:hypothetical protein
VLLIEFARFGLSLGLGGRSPIAQAVLGIDLRLYTHSTAGKSARATAEQSYSS